MTRYVQVPVYTKVVATICHNDRWYTCTEKVATRSRDGATVFEYSSYVAPKDGEACGTEYRLWARADGTEIEED